MSKLTSTETTDMKKTSVIEIKSGRIQGYVENGLEIFKNIPFAEPPVGDLRFKAPVAKKLWNDVLDATEYGFCAFQGFSALEAWFGKEKPESEDCLNLNVWTPATDGKKRPVMVWIHGGSYITGSGKNPLYDGSHLARRGDVVIVTINYRLGSFGFLSVPGSNPNAGMLDQLEALKWVHDNIENFSGDPDNVTIFGESAGAYSVLSLAALPAAKGLFKRVISQSPPIFKNETTKKVSRNIMRKLGIKKGDVEALSEISAKKIIKAQNKVLATNMVGMGFKPMIDGDIFPKSLLEAIKNGECKNLDFMIGSNLEEFKLFAAAPQFQGLGDEELEKLAINILNTGGVDVNKAKEMVESYKKEGVGSNFFDTLMILLSDASFRIHSCQLLEAQNNHNSNTYNYLFEMKSPMMEGLLGACHALELPFVFGTHDIPKVDQFSGKGPIVESVSQQMMDAWIAFARTGNPNTNSIPEWLAYETGKRATMVFGPETKLVEKFLDKQREAWGDLLSSLK